MKRHMKHQTYNKMKFQGLDLIIIIGIILLIYLHLIYLQRVETRILKVVNVMNLK